MADRFKELTVSVCSIVFQRVVSGGDQLLVDLQVGRQTEKTYVSQRQDAKMRESFVKTRLILSQVVS